MDSITENKNIFSTDFYNDPVKEEKCGGLIPMVLGKE